MTRHRSDYEMFRDVILACPEISTRLQNLCAGPRTRQKEILNMLVEKGMIIGKREKSWRSGHTVMMYYATAKGREYAGYITKVLQLLGWET